MRRNVEEGGTYFFLDSVFDSHYTRKTYFISVNANSKNTIGVCHYCTYAIVVFQEYIFLCAPFKGTIEAERWRGQRCGCKLDSVRLEESTDTSANSLTYKFYNAYWLDYP